MLVIRSSCLALVVVIFCNCEAKHLTVSGNGQCKCVPFDMCCDPLSDKESPNPGKIGEGPPILEGVVDDRNHIPDSGNIQNPKCDKRLHLCCEKLCRPLQCGIRTTNKVMITYEKNQDVPSKFGDYPWMVAVLNTDKDYIGGGSLVHPRVVLTAAHKVDEFKKDDFIAGSLVARLGDEDLNSTFEHIQNINVKKVILHPGYERRPGLKNNVALLILERDVDITDSVRPVCLPQADHIFDGSYCIVTGWGTEVLGRITSFRMTMKIVSVPALSHNECTRMLRKDPNLSLGFNLDDTFTCAGGQGHGACIGDGGSPLVCPSPDNPDVFVQVGVAAWGIGNECGIAGNPDVYGSVPKTVDWIRRTIESEVSSIALIDERIQNQNELMALGTL